MNITTARFRIVVKWYPSPGRRERGRRDNLVLLLVFVTGYAIVRLG